MKLWRQQAICPRLEQLQGCLLRKLLAGLKKALGSTSLQKLVVSYLLTYCISSGC